MLPKLNSKHWRLFKRYSEVKRLKRLTCYKQVWQQIQCPHKKVNALLNILLRLISLFLRSANLSSADTLPKQIKSVSQNNILQSLYLCTLMCIPLIFLDLKEFIVTTLGCKDMGIRKSKFVVKAQFLYKKCL